MVPVTTKPFISSVVFIILQQGIPAFFLLIKEEINKHITSRLRDVSIYDRFSVFLFLMPGSLIRLRFGDNSTNASNHGAFRAFTSFVFSESHLKEDIYNGKSSGV